MMTEQQTKKKKTSIKTLLLVQAIVFLYSLVSMLSKFSSGVMENYGLFSIQFVLLFGGMVGCLGVYAILWQQILKKVDLIAAYVHKSTTLIWSMLWSVTLFHETIEWNNVVGILVVVAGIILVTQND